MKQVLITGANKGIGLATAEAILEGHSNTRVIVGSRDRQRGQAAVDGLLKAHPSWNGRLDLLEIDVGDDRSVRRAADQVRAEHVAHNGPLYGVVNNAGIGFGSTDLKTVLNVNARGIERVCDAFIPLLDPKVGRIVNITSAAGPNFVAECSPERQRFFLDNTLSRSSLDSFMDDCCTVTGGASEFAKRGLADGGPYGLSKACANTYTLIAARENPQLKVNACTPGFIATDLTRPYAEAAGKSPTEMGMKPPAEGTRATLFLLFGQPQGTGRYYGSDAIRSPLDRYRAPGAPPYAGN